MSAITFDTLKYADRLEAAGVPPLQARESAGSGRSVGLLLAGLGARILKACF